jgi:hypothetical protein
LRALFTMVAISFMAALLLAVVQPWYSANLYVPIESRNYLTIEDRSGFWVVRVGDVGDINGFCIGLTTTNSNVRAMRSKIAPFPVNWVMDWCFVLHAHSPYFLMMTPLYFPAILLGIWPVRRIVRCVRGCRQLSIQS